MRKTGDCMVRDYDSDKDAPITEDTQVNPSVTESEDARQRVSELEAQVEALMRQISALQRTIVDWHSAMFGAINLILKPYQFNLTIEREHLLNLMPTRIDCLVIKKDGDIPIELDAFRLFRKHNIIELKSFRDDLDESVLWHTISYAASYRSLEPEVRTADLTISIFRNSFPRKLMGELEALGWKVEQPYHNIFYLSGMIGIPVQIVVTKDLGEEYLPLQILTGRAKEADVRKFAAYRVNLAERSDQIYADAVLWACSEANADLFRKLKEEKAMYGVLRDIMKDDLVKEREEERLNTLNTVAERMINAGVAGDEIALATNLPRQDIDTIARGLNRTVSWNEAGA